MHIAWAKLQPELKQHVAVHAAYVDALCMAAGVPEALSALKRMLDLFAAQRGQTPRHMQPEQFLEAPSAHPASEMRLLGPSVTPDSSSMGLEASSQPGAPSLQPSSQSHRGVSAAYHSFERGTSLPPHGAMAAEPQSAPAGVPFQPRQLERASQLEVEQSSVALRAAQAACHQVLNAAAKVRQTSVPQKVLQAMHQVTLPSVIYSRPTSLTASQYIFVEGKRMFCHASSAALHLDPTFHAHIQCSLP